MSALGAMLARMPDLIRTPHGWTYPPRPPCPCGATGRRAGWTFCRCAGASGGGHPSWRCKGCDAVVTLDCAGVVPVPGPMESYGCR